MNSQHLYQCDSICDTYQCLNEYKWIYVSYVPENNYLPMQNLNIL